MAYLKEGWKNPSLYIYNFFFYILLDPLDPLCILGRPPFVSGDPRELMAALEPLFYNL